MIKNIKKHVLLYVCVLISILLLVLFLFFKSRNYLFLDLDTKWLIVAGVPLLFALFAGKYIKTFEGFGVKLEANLKDIPSSSLVTKSGFNEEYESGIQKNSLDFLDLLNNTERQKIYRLKFIYGIRDYYDVYAIDEYIRKLPNLKFIEIVNEQGQFFCLLPISFLKNGSQPNHREIEKFIERLMSPINLLIHPLAIKDYILRKDNIIDAYKKILTSCYNISSNDCYLPVLNDSNIMTGVVYKSSLERKISEEVIKTID